MVTGERILSKIYTTSRITFDELFHKSVHQINSSLKIVDLDVTNIQQFLVDLFSCYVLEFYSLQQVLYSSGRNSFVSTVNLLYILCFIECLSILTKWI